MRIDMLLKKRFLVHVLMLVCAVGSFAQPQDRTSDWGSYAREGGVKSMEWVIIFTDKVWGYRADGYEGRYYSFSNIKTPEELAWVFNSKDHHVDDASILTEVFTGLELERRGVYIELAADIDMNNYYWQGKGTTKRFYFINGNGHTIKNIHLIGSGSTSDNGNYGFFSDAEDIVFYNVNFEFSSVSTSNSSTSFEKKHKEVVDKNGLLIGNCTGSARFYNVNVKLNSDYTSTKGYVGGLAGFVGGRTAVQNTNVLLNGKMSANNRVGGFVGSTPNIETANSSVILNSDIASSGEFAGGLAGSVGERAAVQNTNVELNGKLTASQYAGGFVGGTSYNFEAANSSVILNSDIASSGEFAGGLVGSVSNKAILSNVNVYMDGTISAYQHAGGFIGYTKSVEATNSSVKSVGSNSGISIENSFAGSFVGRQSTAVKSTYTNCHSEGLHLKGIARTGGLIGQLDNSDVTFSNCSFKGGITSDYVVGGFVALTLNASVTIKDNCSVEIDEISGKWPSYFAGGVGKFGDKSHLDGKLVIDGFSMGDATKSRTYKTDASYSMAGCVAWMASNTELSVNNFSLKNVVFEGSSLGAVVGEYYSTNKITISNSDISNVSMVGTKPVGGFVGYTPGSLDFNNCNVTLANNDNFKSSGDYVGGLAGNVGGNITVAKTNVKLNGLMSGANYVGGCAGFAQSINASECSVISDNANGRLTGGNMYVAGFVGRLQGSYKSTLTDCKSEGLTLSGSARIAGFFGEVISANVTFTGCSFKGGINSNFAVGGYVAITENASITVKDCSVTLNEKSGTWPSYVGGIVGNLGPKKDIVYSDKLIVDNFTMGDAQKRYSYKIKNNSYAAAGCVALMAEGTELQVNRLSLKNIELNGNCLGAVVGECTSDNTITISNSEVSNVVMVGSNPVGGYVGYTKGGVEISNSEVSNVVMVGSNHVGGYVGYTKGGVEISNPVGGYVGYSKGDDLIISNITLKNVSVYTDRDFAGGIVGYTEGKLLVDGVNGSADGYCNVSCKSSLSKAYTGGVVGLADNGADIKNANLYVNVSGCTETGIGVGGITCTIREGTEFNISNSNIYGSMVDLDKTSGKYVSGLVGYNDGTLNIDKCSFNGKVMAKGYAGGFVAKNQGVLRILNSENNGEITIDTKFSGDYENYYGGFVGVTGSNDSGSRTSGKLDILNCTNNGTIAPGRMYAAGFVAMVNTTDAVRLYNLTNKGVIEAVSEAKEKKFYGGIVGRLKYAKDADGDNYNMVIKYCHNEADITAKASCGGIVGTNEGSFASLISDCYNEGSIKIKIYDENSDKIYDENSDCGGIIGTTGDDADKMIVQYCYNKGNVQFVDANGNFVKQAYGIGCVDGAHSLVKNCYNISAVDGEIPCFAKTSNAKVDNCYQLIPDAVSAVKDKYGKQMSDTRQLNWYDSNQAENITLLDRECFNAGKVAYLLSADAKSDIDEVHYVQNLNGYENKATDGSYDDMPVMTYYYRALDSDLYNEDDGWEINYPIVSRNDVTSRIVYQGEIYRDNHDTSYKEEEMNGQPVAHQQKQGYTNSSNSVLAVPHDYISYIDAIGNGKNNYIKMVSGALLDEVNIDMWKMCDERTSQTDINCAWDSDATIVNGVTHYNNLEANEIRLTDPSVNGATKKELVVPYNFYAPSDIRVVGDIEYRRVMRNGKLASLDLPFDVEEISYYNNGAKQEVCFNPNDNGFKNNPHILFEELSDFEQKDGSNKVYINFQTASGNIIPAGKYMVTYSGPDGSVVCFRGSGKINKTNCPYTDTEAKPFNQPTDNSAANGMELRGFTQRYIANATEGENYWKNYLYLDYDKNGNPIMRRGATCGGVWSTPFRAMLYASSELIGDKGDVSSAGAKAIYIRSMWRNYEVDEATDIETIESANIDAETEVDVYSVDGLKVRSAVKYGEALDGLQKGIYIINGIKVFKK
ncbi:hypothetical protein SAMN05216518_10764 [Bacteroidales bacterium KHT7]|nr:hypothetical protein SAMN05216518_10764 [Bacteroidales bacterium KHT7]